jgi:hypothetical protein
VKIVGDRIVDTFVIDSNVSYSFDYGIKDAIDLDKEELVAHNLYQFSNIPQDDTLSHEHEVEVNNPKVESSLATVIPDYYISEDLIALDINHMDQLSYIQMESEISKSSLQQLSDLQTDGIVRNCEKQNCRNHLISS